MPPAVWPGAFCAAVGAALGTIAVQRIDTGVLRRVIPLVLIAVALYFQFSPRLGDEDRRARMTMSVFTPVPAGGIAFYDGLLGLGTGAFLVAATAGLLGQNLRLLQRMPSFSISRAMWGHSRSSCLTATWCGRLVSLWRPDR
jgi:uncharacterized membrane protein YfcA